MTKTTDTPNNSLSVTAARKRLVLGGPSPEAIEALIDAKLEAAFNRKLDLEKVKIQRRAIMRKCVDENQSYSSISKVYVIGERDQ